MTLSDILSALLTAITWIGLITLGLFGLAGLCMVVLMIALATHKPCKCEEAGWPCKEEKGGVCESKKSKGVSV